MHDNTISGIFFSSIRSEVLRPDTALPGKEWSVAINPPPPSPLPENTPAFGNPAAKTSIFFLGYKRGKVPISPLLAAEFVTIYIFTLFRGETEKLYESKNERRRKNNHNGVTYDST